jgi:UDP-GlcNAc:undecaprenyl-phosphate GlcNAc-1-phosphate transferase
MFPFLNDMFLLMVPAISLVLTLACVPMVRRLAAHWGCVAVPKKDRWHSRPTPTLGGMAFYVGFIVTALLFSPNVTSALPFLLVVTLMFLVGVYDDRRQLNPATKLVGQIASAAVAIYFGYRLYFFGWAPLDGLLTAVWIVGLTNAVNLLDNMDGLAGGIGLIAAAYLTILFFQQGDVTFSVIALAIAGAVGGFLMHNFYPASLFMGDAGSLFLGASLSLLTIHANGQASNILSLVAVPSCILLVPILDTTLVTITRLLRGQPISQGGKDHSSHRLVTLGLSEPHAVLLLYLMAIVAGATAIFIKAYSYSLSLAILPLVLIAFSLFTAYLAQVEVLSSDEVQRRAKKRRFTVLLSNLTYKRRLVQVLLDMAVISTAYYLAFAMRFEFHLDAFLLNLFVDSLPVVLIASYAAFFLFGNYRGLWRYTGIEDLVSISKAAICATVVSMVGLLAVYGLAGYSRIVVLVYGLLLFVGVAGTRLSFRLFASLIHRPRQEKIPVLIYGAGDGGEVVLRECRQNAQVAFRPIGFIDDDPLKQGRTVAGLRVLGGADKLPEILRREKIEGCIISSPKILTPGHAEQIRLILEERGLWIKQLRLEFVAKSTGG